MNAEAQSVCGESTVAESTVGTSRRVPVKGLSRLSTYIRGKEILILGPGNVGKSKFAQYLRLATLDPEGKREMTYAITRSPAFVVALGPQEGRVLRVRRTVDVPGQVGPHHHALLVARRRPHAVIIILDCSCDPRGMLRWLCLFCSALDSVLRKAAPVARRLQEMVVILNKRDKIDDREFAKLRQAVRKALERFLLVVWGEERVRSIPILECISVRTERGTALIEGVVAQLAQRLGGRQDQPGAAAGPKLVVVSPAGPRPCPSRPPCRGAPTPASSPEHSDPATQGSPVRCTKDVPSEPAGPYAEAQSELTPEVSSGSEKPGPIDSGSLPSDLVQVMTAWPKLPEHIKATVLALVGTAGRQECQADPGSLPSDLAQVVTAWPRVPDHIKAAVLALIGTAGRDEPTNPEA